MMSQIGRFGSVALRALTLVFAVCFASAIESGAVGASELNANPAWTRSLGAFERPAFILAPLPEGNLLVRSGAGVAALDAASGKTIWFIPDVLDASVHARSVLIRRADIVFAVRSIDGAILWKTSCTNARYLIAVGHRALTLCGNASTVLDVETGNILRSQPAHFRMSPSRIEGARALNDRFAIIANDFDGAWGGTEYAIVDSTSGAYLWSQTDFSVLAVSAQDVLIAPYPGMLPWAPTGTVVRRRLIDGAVRGTRTYQLPPGSDPDSRGEVTFTRSAAYVTTSIYTLYRFSRGTTDAARLAERAHVEAALNDSLFYVVGNVNDGTAGDLWVSRGRGIHFSDSLTGHYSGLIVAGGDNDNVGLVGLRVAVRSGSVIVASQSDGVAVLDESGTVIQNAKNACSWGRRHVLHAGNRLFVLCDPSIPTSRPELSEYLIQ
jgi:hypothetical protein